MLCVFSTLGVFECHSSFFMIKRGKDVAESKELE